MAFRLPRPWYSQEERDMDRFDTGRQGAFARAGRQAAARDQLTPESGTWRPGPAPRPRRVRAQEREIQQRRDDTGEARRASVLARAMEQATARDRAARAVSPRAGRGSR